MAPAMSASMPSSSMRGALMAPPPMVGWRWLEVGKGRCVVEVAAATLTIAPSYSMRGALMTPPPAMGVAGGWRGQEGG